jgi:hypothetical protein
MCTGEKEVKKEREAMERFYLVILLALLSFYTTCRMELRVRMQC